MTTLAPAADSPEVTELLADASGGSAAAAEQLVTRHLHLVRSVVECRMDRLLRARLDPADVMQEVGLRMTTRLADYLARRPMPFHLWVRKTAAETLIDLRRKHLGAECRAVGNEVPIPDRSSLMLVNHLAGGGPTASVQMRADEAAALVRRAVASLEETDREVILLRSYEGLTNADAAAVLGLDVSAASKRYARALLKLRQLLQAEGLTSG
jgi:RNA polymerase sigma-70 factor (ECF subfamily)